METERNRLHFLLTLLHFNLCFQMSSEGGLRILKKRLLGSIGRLDSQ